MTDRPDVVARLRVAADGHRPDRARMWARVSARLPAGSREEAGRVRPRPRRAWPRMAGAAGGLVAVLAAGGLAVDRVAGGGEPWGERAPAGAGVRDGGPPSAAPSAGGGEPGPREDRLRSRGVLGPGNNAHWAQSGVVLHCGERLASLTVELRVAPAGGVRHTGFWSTLPADDFEVTVREEGGALVYRWTLRKGRAVPPGEHRFVGQYGHAEGLRDAGRDSYTVHATGPGGPVSAEGDFRRVP
ncbi:hypothetical protein [Streptomyces radiopugnans]|uniref:Uncharacterized protein n=1 Tax=Streptomyces radiopugnans TaxID=403935 RepID=A0A1H9A6G7_9ACTN|nr:hypothetical protein [Streptomyces radiopugnans]SEP72244.1 hypothetical protein SAMN05216481_101907 [Streptomyces radiopugnans]